MPPLGDCFLYLLFSDKDFSLLSTDHSIIIIKVCLLLVQHSGMVIILFIHLGDIVSNHILLHIVALLFERVL